MVLSATYDRQVTNLKKILHRKRKVHLKTTLHGPLHSICHDKHHTFHPAQSEDIFSSSYNKINNHIDKSKHLVTKRLTERERESSDIHRNGGNEGTQT